MNIRNRVLSILKGEKPDIVPWLGDLDYWIHYLNCSGKRPEKYKGKSGVFALHRDLGVGFYLQGYFPFKTVDDGVQIKRQTNDGITITTVETPVGTIRDVWKQIPESYTQGPQEHYLKDYNDLKVIRYLYEHRHYEPDYKLAEERYELIGDNGVVLCYTPRSPLMELVTSLGGIEATTFALLDEPDEFNETLEVMERKIDEAAQIALESPAECIMIPENLSSEVVGKELFEKYIRRFETKWNKRINDAGKYSFIHMDGTMKGLIREVASTGFRVLEALTPHPVGDIPMEEIHDWVCDDTIIWGGLPGLYFTDLISDGEFDSFVIRMLEVMKRQPRYVLGVADQVPPGARWERIQRVSRLVEQYGEMK